MKRINQIDSVLGTSRKKYIEYYGKFALYYTFLQPPTMPFIKSIFGYTSITIIVLRKKKIIKSLPIKSNELHSIFYVLIQCENNNVKVAIKRFQVNIIDKLFKTKMRKAKTRYRVSFQCVKITF